MSDRELIDFKKLTNKEMLVVLAERQSVTHEKLEDIEIKFDGEISAIHKKINDERKNTVRLQISNERHKVKWMMLAGGLIFIAGLIGNYVMDYFFSHLAK